MRMRMCELCKVHLQVYSTAQTQLLLACQHDRMASGPGYNGPLAALESYSGRYAKVRGLNPFSFQS